MAKREDETWHNIKAHPPTCACAQCRKKNIGVPPPGVSQGDIVVRCPKCRRKSLFWNERDSVHECLNPRCRRVFTQHEREGLLSLPLNRRSPIDAGRSELSKTERKRNTEEKGSGTRASVPIPNWGIAVFFIIALSSIGVAIGGMLSSPIPPLALFGGSITFSVEKWFIRVTNRHKVVGMSYRLFANLLILGLFGTLVWTGIQLFSHHLHISPMRGSLLLLGEFALFIWMWRVIAKNSWRRPSMKATLFCLSLAFAVTAFAGVKPMSGYKDSSFDWISREFNNANQTARTNTVTNSTMAIPVPTPQTTPMETPIGLAALENHCSQVTRKYRPTLSDL